VGTPHFMSWSNKNLAISSSVAADVRIKLIRSSPYYAQANGQAEASNQILIKLIKGKIDEHPRRWHEVLSEALWAHRISCHGATKTSPYHLVYGQEAILPYMLEELDGVKFPVAVNGQHLKKYFPSMWDN
jgi:hypothetical protein